MRAITNMVALRDEILAAIIRHHKMPPYMTSCTCGKPWNSSKHIEGIIELVLDENTVEITEVL